MTAFLITPICFNTCIILFNYHRVIRGMVRMYHGTQLAWGKVKRTVHHFIFERK